MLATSASSGAVGGLHTTSVVDRINGMGKDRVPFSVEFYPPRDEAAEARGGAARVFERLSPAFVSVTYGAGGSTRIAPFAAGELAPRHHAVAGRAPDRGGPQRGRAAPDDRLLRRLRDKQRAGAVVGDLQGGVHEEWRKHPEGLEYAVEMVALVRELGDFHVGVASFPAGHPRRSISTRTLRANWSPLRAGAEYSITQMFFNVDDYLGCATGWRRIHSSRGEADHPGADADHLVAHRATPGRAVRRGHPADLLARFGPPRATARRRTVTKSARSASNWPPR